jgi:hypothetical protein
MNDSLTDSLNAPAGRLAEVLLKKLSKGRDDRELPDALEERFDRLVNATGSFGKLARVRLAAEVSLLFERAPKWTKENLIPSFDWASPDAAAVWSARKYSSYIGKPELVGLTKKPFLEMFGRPDVSEEDLRIFSEWLIVMMLANQREKADYPITAAEARAALRRAGSRILWSVGHELALEMERAKPEEKLSKWHNVVRPVFEAVWPLDVELQTSASTFKLVQILRAAGEAFSEAASVIIPFVRPEDPRHHTSVFSISEADDVLYSTAPDKMLELLAAAVGDAVSRSPYGLRKALDRIQEKAPPLADSKRFQRLANIAALQ